VLIVAFGEAISAQINYKKTEKFVQKMANKETDSERISILILADFVDAYDGIPGGNIRVI